MKKIVTLSAIAFLSTAAFAETDVQKQIDELNMKIERLQQINNKQDDRISDVNILAAQDNLKFDVDFRTAYDNLQYETVNGNKYENDALFLKSSMVRHGVCSDKGYDL
jgi:TolA-binding protein